MLMAVIFLVILLNKLDTHIVYIRRIMTIYLIKRKGFIEIS